MTAAPTSGLPSRPLSGVRVVELTHIAAGPFCGMLLADLGADVVKVEPPSGDLMRQWPPLADDGEGGDFSLNFASLNRNKRSIVADLKDPGQLADVHRLISSADVLVENYRTGVLDRLGLGFEQFADLGRPFVYCSISGFGHTSPYAQRGAFDVVIQAMSGLMSVTGEPDGPPVKCGVPVGDFVAGLYAALTAVSVLRDPARSAPTHIDCSLLDSLLAISALQTSEYYGTGLAPRPLGTAHPRNAPYQVFPTADGDLTIAAGNDALYAAMCRVIGRDDLIDDPRFARQLARVANRDELVDLVTDALSARSADEWLPALEAAGVPVGRVNTFADILADEHVVATGLLQDVAVPGFGPMPTVQHPARIAGTSARNELPPPRLGEHTEEVLAEWVEQ